MVLGQLNHYLSKFGFRLINIKRDYPNLELSPESIVFQYASTKQALYRARLKGINVKNVIDVGASNGAWSEMCMKLFPKSNYLLIEANDYHLSALKEFKTKYKEIHYVIAAAGDTDGSCYFDNSNPFGGVAGSQKYGNVKNSTKMICLDNEVKRQKLSGNYLLKLDTHGFEQSILKGSIEILKKTDLIIIESYIFNLNTPQSVTFDKLCNIMSDLGFRVGDFSEPLWRNRDLALWQFDLFFYRKEHTMFKNNDYE